MRKTFLLAALVVIGVCGCSEPEQMKIVAISGNADAAYELSREYAKAGGASARKRATRWLRVAADWGKAEAQLDLGKSIYPPDIPQSDRGEYLGFGEQVAFEEAVSWIGKAAAQGNPIASLEMIRYRLLWMQIKRSRSDAFDWNPWKTSCQEFREELIRGLLIGWQKAAKSGDTGKSIACARLLAARYSELSDQPNQQLWLTRAAEMGDANAQFQLAKMYLKGDGDEKSLEKAIGWLQKAIDQGEPEAQKLMETLSQNFGGSAMLKAGEYNSK